MIQKTFSPSSKSCCCDISFTFHKCSIKFKTTTYRIFISCSKSNNHINFPILFNSIVKWKKLKILHEMFFLLKLCYLLRNSWILILLCEFDLEKTTTGSIRKDVCKMGVFDFHLSCNIKKANEYPTLNPHFILSEDCFYYYSIHNQKN